MSVPKTARECGDEGVSAGRGPGQIDWYRFAVRYVEGKTVLDVGAGLGHGVSILGERAALAEGQDRDPQLASRGIRIVSLDEIPDNSYDVVTSVDVIEHIPDDRAFVATLARIARRGVFVTTPNWTASRCTWPYHIREYRPIELERLMDTVGRVSLMKGTPSGSHVYPVRFRTMFHAFNALRTWPLTSFLARCLNRLLPDRCKLHSHLGVWVELG